MKKLLFLGLFLSPVLLLAQTKKEKKIIKEAAASVCSCLNQSLKPMSTDAREVLILALENPGVAQNKLATFSDERQLQIANELKGIEGIETCFENPKLQRAIDEVDIDNESEIMEMVSKAMSKQKNCKDAQRIASRLFKLLGSMPD